MTENIYVKLQKVRCEVQKKCTKKSGKNSYAGFEYFELKDFLAVSNEEFLKEGLCPVFSIKSKTTETGIDEYATLTISDGENTITFETPSADPQMAKQNAIQNLGAKHTYLKRYLYLNALELAENDAVDSTIGKENEKPTTEIKSATERQVEILLGLYQGKEDKLNELYSKLKIKSFNDLSMSQASDLIKKLSAKKENG